MNLIKYICANILSFIGIWLFLLTIFFITTDYHYETIVSIGDSLIEHRFIYLTSIFYLIIALPIEILFHKFTRHRFILNIKFKNEFFTQTYKTLFWFGLTSSIFYLSVYIWGISKI